MFRRVPSHDAARHLLDPLAIPDFHHGKYTGGSPESQGFVGCNRSAAGERSSLANDLEAARRKRVCFERLPGCRVSQESLDRIVQSVGRVSTDRVLGQGAMFDSQESSVQDPSSISFAHFRRPGTRQIPNANELLGLFNRKGSNPSRSPGQLQGSSASRSDVLRSPRGQSWSCQTGFDPQRKLAEATDMSAWRQ